MSGGKLGITDPGRRGEVYREGSRDSLRRLRSVPRQMFLPLCAEKVGEYDNDVD